MGVIDEIRERIFLLRHRRDRYESQPLRDHFARKHDIRVGMYSYGCFDRRRIPPGTTIGRYCSIASSARVIDANHPIEALSTHPYFYGAAFGIVDTDKVVPTRIVIEDDVWISHNVTITPGCGRIGRGAILGAGSIVTKDVPPYAIVAGAPARVMRYRFDEATIDLIEDSKWWTLDKADLRRLVAEKPDFVFAPQRLTR